MTEKVLVKQSEEAKAGQKVPAQLLDISQVPVLSTEALEARLQPV